jgi:hypothetical protein
MEQSVSIFVRVVISDSLKKIPPKLQVTSVYSAIARAWDNFLAYAQTTPRDKESTLLHG